MSTQINVKCIDQTLALVSTPLIASGGINEDVVNFTFCQKWDGFSKTAVFYRKPEDVYYSLIDSDNACIIPQEVLKEDGYLFFGVFGSNANGVIRTSEVLKYKIEKGAITENIKPSDPTPSIYEQLLTKYQEILELCEDTATAESEFETLITNKQNAFETSLTNKQTAFENKISKQQTDYETDLSKQWTDYKTDLTNQQTEFETSTTEKLNTYEENVESIAETSAKNAINTASQDKTVTLSTTWQYDSTNGYYTQSVAVVGMKATDKPILGIETSGNASNIATLRKEWSKVIQAETYDGGIKFYAKSATTVNLTVVIKPELSKVTVNNVSSAEAGIDELQEQVNTNTNKINSIVDVIYPVGSIYMSFNDVDPSKLFGGTWEPIYNRFLLTSGSDYSLGTYGGEATHTLTVDEMPSHKHLPYVDGNTSDSRFRLLMGNDSWYNENAGTSNFRVTGSTSGEYKGFEANTNIVGGSQAHNNMPPYIVVNAWIRRT